MRDGMGVKRSIKNLLNRLLLPHGYTLAHIDAPAAPQTGAAVREEIPSNVSEAGRQDADAPTHAIPGAPIVEPMEQALVAIQQRKHRVRTIIDIGASDGRWTALALRQFPDCAYLLIEAQPVHAAALKTFASGRPNVQVALAAAGEKSGTIHFDATDPFGGIASEHPFPNNDIVVPVTTLDREVRARNLAGPFLIKFDTHGFEVPILNGARETLAQTEVLVMECYNFKIAGACLLFHEMCAHLEREGFRCIDLVDPMRRPLDNCLWQMDLVFARNTRAEFSQARYQ
jgi:FkbM family methyltransferase